MFSNENIHAILYLQLKQVKLYYNVVTHKVTIFIIEEFHVDFKFFSLPYQLWLSLLSGCLSEMLAVVIFLWIDVARA